MNKFTAQLNAALRELKAWRGDLPVDDQTSGGTYDSIEKMLRDSIAIADGDEFYTQIAGINRFICDQGPLTPDFIPSFRSLFLDLYEQHQTKSA